MSEFFRRASDALHHRQRQGSTGSTDSTDAPKSAEAKEPPEQEPLSQKPEPAQPDSHVNETSDSIADCSISLSYRLDICIWYILTRPYR